MCHSTFATVFSITLLMLPALCCLGEPQPRSPQPQPTSVWAYLGTYTGPKSKSQGIYVVRLDLAAGTMASPELAGEAINPSFVALHPSGKFLYSVSEGGKKSGNVSAFKIEAGTGKLTHLNDQPSGGPGPCHVWVDGGGRYAMAANYGGGSIALLPLNADGSLREPTCTIQFEGKGPNPKRQEKPHAHQIITDAADRFVFVPDLGTDQVMIFRLDAEKHAFSAAGPTPARVAAGSGPRHIDFHPNGRFAYVINELANTVTAFTYDAASGKLSQIQTVPTLPTDFAGANTTAEILVHPSGKFLYGTNRGHDSVAIFAIDEQSGRLTPRGCVSSGGKTPRGMGIDPTGQYLLAGHQDSNNVTSFRIDPSTGQLTATGQSLDVGSPVCVKFCWPF